MNPDKLFSLLSPKQVLSQESQQAYQSKVNTAKAENKMIKEKVVNPFFSFADKSFKKIMEVLNPGESYVAPALKKIGVNPILAGGIGLGVDILAPGPGELGRVAKVGKEAKVGSELIQEAKKYKSAEEFVSAQPTVYHGTNTKFDVFDKSKIGEATGVGDWGDGFYFSDNKDVAKSFAKDAGGDIVMEVSLKNLKFADGNKLEKLPEVQDILDDGMGFTDIGEYLKSKGYDGVKYKHKEGGGTEYVVYDADKIKTKSQLTDIWNQANKKTK